MPILRCFLLPAPYFSRLFIKLVCFIFLYGSCEDHASIGATATQLRGIDTAEEFGKARMVARGNGVKAESRARAGYALLRDTQEALRPNIIWIMADDLGWGEAGPFADRKNGRRIETPNLDEFGEEGMIFRHAYSGYAVGGPSRTAFFTGRHSGQFWKHGLSGETITPLQGKESLPMILKKAGYRTGAFGKVSPFLYPLKTGFDEFTGQVDPDFCHNMYPSRVDTGHGKYNLNVGNREASRQACQHSPTMFNYSVDLFYEASMTFLDEVARGPDPFFMYVSYTIPHAGAWTESAKGRVEGQPVPTTLHYGDQPWPDVEKDHAAAVSYLDLKLGDLMQRLVDLGIDEDTLVFFASDNGAHDEGGHDHKFFESSGGLKGKKGSFYEGGVRSPTMARWPAVISRAQVSDYIWAFWDVLPTISELAGVECPPGIDGISIVPTLLGKSQEPKDHIYFTARSSSLMPKDGPFISLSGERNRSIYRPGYSIRKGKWKGIVSQCSDINHMLPSTQDEMELYNLEEDSGEENNVAKEHPDVVKGLLQLVIRRRYTCACFQCDWPSA